jgi:hypothetical protein
MILSNIGMTHELDVIVNSLTTAEPTNDAMAAYCSAGGLMLGRISMMCNRQQAQRLLTRLKQVAPSVPENEVLAHGLMHLARGPGKAKRRVL